MAPGSDRSAGRPSARPPAGPGARTPPAQPRTAIITGASRGLGLALARRLAGAGWSLVVDARGEAALRRAALDLQAVTDVRALVGDITDPAHRGDLVEAAAGMGGLTAVVNNASTLGVTPLPELARYPLGGLRVAFETNAVAPLALIQLALPRLVPGGVIVNVTSDAAREPYPGWGGYGATKAALEQMTAVLAAERRTLRFYAVDPGDLDTQMHAEADPEADAGDLADPEERARALQALVEGELPSGRHRAVDLLPVPAGGAR